MKPQARHLHIVLLLAVCTLFAIAITLLFQLKPQAQRGIAEASYPQVQVEVVTAQNGNIGISSQGLLQVLNEQNIIAQTQGTITLVNEAILLSKRFNRDDLLFSIDDTHAKYNLQQAASQQKQAQLQLAELKAHLQSQTQHNRKGSLGEISQMQLSLATQQLETANTALKLAQQQLEATHYYAPFDGKALQHQLKEGSLVTAGMPLATIYPTLQYQIRVPLSLQQYHLLGLSSGDNNIVIAVDESSGTQITGHVDHIEGQLSSNRLIYLTAVFNELTDEQFNKLVPLSMMSVTIRSHKIKNLIRIPNYALRSQNTVWLLSNNNTLDIRPISILYRDRDFVYVKQGLETGERLITSHLANALPGMRLLNALNHD